MTKAMSDMPCGRVRVLLEAYLDSGLPATTMGRTLREDEDFFRAALAAGAVLAAKIGVA